MKARFIIGRAGAGKTSLALSEIAQNIDSGFEKPLLLLVPNQFSLEMEKKLVRKTGGRGMDIAQVLSFERLSYRVFSLYGRPDKKILEETGKAALLRKILHDNRNSLKFYGGAYRREGFISLVSEMLTEFYKYGLDCGKLEEMSGSAQLRSTQLASKISDLALILKEFSDYIKDDYIVTEQNLDLLAEALPGAPYFSGCKVWLDGFFRFTEQDCAVIRALAGICGEMTVSLTMPETVDLEGLNAGIPVYDPFYEPKAAAARLAAIFKEAGCMDIECERVTKGGGHGFTAPLIHLEREYFNHLPKRFEGVNNSVMLTKAPDVYGEINGVAMEIAELVREKGYRYKDVAVCVCDLEEYGHIVADTFENYGIPFFLDKSRQIYGKSLVETVRALLETGVSGWDAESVIRLLRAGLLGFTETETDILENYVLEYGITGYKWKLRQWKAGAKNERYDLEQINALKSRVTSIICPFLDMFAGKKKPSVKQASLALFEFIDKNGVKQRLVTLEKSPREAVQIWGIVVSAFEKAVEVLADEIVDIRLYSQIIEGALSCAEEGFIPQTADAVIIGDIKRTRLPEIKALFVGGLVDGALPSPKSADGLLTDAERATLAETGAKLAPFGVRKALAEQYMVYLTVTKPTERLYLSRPTTGFDGEELRSSIIIDKIGSMFPIAEKHTQEGFFSGKAFVSELAVKKGEQGILVGIWAEGLKWLRKNDKHSFELIESGAFSKKKAGILSSKSVKSLIGKDIFSSVTRIEKYIQCPFSYFAEHGLRARERVIYGLKPVDLGNVYHNALDNISAAIKENGLKWGTLAGGEADAIVENAVEAAVGEMELFRETNKNKYMAERLKRITKRAVWALDYHIAKGSFIPSEHETGFGTGDNPLPPVIIELDEGYKIIFTGRIDRVDILDKDGKRYVKIIDYKSGAKKFSLQEVYYGLQLQLMLYMDAYLKSGENNVPAGVFYFRVTDPVVSGAAADEEGIIDEILGELKLSGLVVNDSDIIDALHSGLSGASNIIPVKLNKPKKAGLPGEPSANSSVATSEQFYLLMKRVTKVVREAGNRIIAGDIEPAPARGVGAGACTYCGYLSICGFDANTGYRYNNMKRLKSSEVYELLQQQEEK